MDKRDEKPLFPFVSRRDHGAAPGVRGSNCAEMACFYEPMLQEAPAAACGT